MRTRRLIIAGAVLLVLALAGAGIYLRITRDAAGTEETARAGGDLPGVSADSTFRTDLALPVEVAEVVQDTLVLSVSAAGQAASRQQTVVRSQVSGQVMAVRVAENQGVGSNTVLVEIDPTEYRLALEEANAALRQADSQYRELTIDSEKIADARVRAQRDSAARARSGVDRAQIAVMRAQLNLNRTRVQAPFAGRVANLRVVRGQHINAGEELLTVLAMDPIRVVVQVLEGHIGFLAPGRAARVTFSAFQDETFDGRIESINPLVDQQTRTARVTVAVPNPRGRILPGMYARALLAARRFPDRILVPREAVLERNTRTMLFVYNEQDGKGRAEWRYVNTGLANDRFFEIVEEGPETGMVEPGERVLTAGHYSLTHDALVRAVEDASAAEGSRVR